VVEFGDVCGVIISPDFYDQNRMALLNERFVLVLAWFRIKIMLCT
jgi:hypothetical protein